MLPFTVVMDFYPSGALSQKKKKSNPSFYIVYALYHGNRKVAKNGVWSSTQNKLSYEGGELENKYHHDISGQGVK